VSRGGHGRGKVPTRDVRTSPREVRRHRTFGDLKPIVEVGFSGVSAGCARPQTSRALTSRRAARVPRELPLADSPACGGNRGRLRAQLVAWAAAPPRGGRRRGRERGASGAAGPDAAIPREPRSSLAARRTPPGGAAPTPEGRG
jgi:hypothetical protein